MSKLAQVLNNGSDPDWWFDTGIPWFKNRTPEPVLTAYSDLYWWLSDVEFHSVTEADWDTLILLDACRYDVFNKLNKLPGETKKRYSSAPRTPEFLQRNFGAETYHDTVYVTANPHVHRHLDRSQFHEVYNVWKTHWDEDLKSVRPESVAEVTRKVHEEYPKKRVIAHFMQPHLPFIGPLARDKIGIYDGYASARLTALEKGGEKRQTDPYALQAAGKINEETIREAYSENLEQALIHVEQLVSEISGRIIVTSDHGELLGDIAWPFPWREYGHPKLMAKKSLEIPWHIVDNESRRTTIGESPSNEVSDMDESVVKSKLEDLGYR